MNDKTVFLSYRQDHTGRAVAGRLFAVLEDEGYKVFRDVESMTAGEWRRQISDAISRCAHFLLVVTPGALDPRADDTDWVREEYEIARQSRRNIVPVLEESINFKEEARRCPDWPESFFNFGWMKLYDANFRSDVVQLIRRFLKPHEPALPSIGERSPGISFPADITQIVEKAPPEFIGRHAEKELLTAAWRKVVAAEAGRPLVIIFVAFAGEGKTSLVAKWAADLAHQGWPGCDTVFAWSFYTQDAQAEPSPDLFLAAALAFFGDPGMASSPQTPDAKAKRLFELVSARRSLLILDGLERLQRAPKLHQRGGWKKSVIAWLLKELATFNNGLCIVTTRYDIPELNAFREGTAPSYKLDGLCTASGVEFLKSLGVTKGPAEEFEKLVEEVRGHPLTLKLIGSYLSKAMHGDIRHRVQIKFEEADALNGGHASAAMATYVQWMEAEGGEAHRALAILRLLGLFKGSVSMERFRALLEPKANLELAQPLLGLSEPALELSLAWLKEAMLLTFRHDEFGMRSAIETHLLIGEYFAQWLHNDEREDAVEAAHAHLSRYYQEKEVGPEPSLEDLQPFYAAVSDGCRAGKFEDARKLYRKKIERHLPKFSDIRLGTKEKDLGRDRAYSTSRLGVIEMDLNVLVGFYSVPWSVPQPTLNLTDRIWLMERTAELLMGVVRLEDAFDCMKACLDLYPSMGDWRGWVLQEVKLCNLRLIRGEVNPCVVRMREIEREDVNRNAQSGLYPEEKVQVLSSYGWALHRQGKFAQSQARFQKAEAYWIKLQQEEAREKSAKQLAVPEIMLAEAEAVILREEAVIEIEDGETARIKRLTAAAEINRGLEIRDECGIKDLSNLIGLYEPLPGQHGFRYCNVLMVSAEAHAWRIYLGKAERDPEVDRLHRLALHEVNERICRMQTWSKNGREYSLRDDGLNQLVTGRSLLFQKLIDGAEHAEIYPILEVIDCAVHRLQRAGTTLYLPLALLTRSWLRSLAGRTLGADSAQSDLEQAWEIAERGPMPLHLAEIRLHRARLFSREPSYPWESPQADLAAARQTIIQQGLGRRKEELEDAEAAILSSPPS